MDPTPENLAERLRQVDPEFPRELRAAAADRIDALERIIRTRTEVSGHNPYGLSDADADLLRSIIEARNEDTK
jgi:hypothetical protein